MSDTTEHKEGSNAHQTLKDKKTIAEILDTAMSFERTARDFYASLVNKVAKPMRALVQELADEEALHYQMFEELKNNPLVNEYINERIDTPVNDHKFSDFIHLPRLDEKPDDQSLLQYALGREHAAMEQYQSLAHEVPEGPLKDTFSFLAQEELEHKKELEKRYYEIVHSGGV